MVAPKPTPKATPKATKKATPKATPKATKKPSVIDAIVVEGFKKLSPDQQDRIAKLFGIMKPPSPKPQPKGTYDPKRWEGVVGDKGW
jgi:hypothetical protein